MRRLGALLLVLAACSKPPAEPPPARSRRPAASEPRVRVHLASLGDWTTLAVRADGGVSVRADGAELGVRERLTLSRNGASVDLDGGPRAVRSLVLRPRQGILRVGEHAFAGELRWHAGRLVNVLALENYVLGVLRGELPLGRVPIEAAAAQAIAVRSYTLHYLDASRPDFDVDDTVLYQCYVGLRYAPDDDSLRAGVRRTAGQYLSYRDAPLKAYYHSTCGGHTTDVRTGLDRANVAPLTGVPCEHCSESKYFRWSVRIEDSVLAHTVRLAPPLERIEVLRRGPGERALELLVVAADGHEERIHAAEFRLAAGPSRLRSTLIREIRRVDGGFEFEGGGWGHGVGLCQMGAIGLAGQGLRADEIVAYYYPGAQLRRAY